MLTVCGPQGVYLNLLAQTVYFLPEEEPLLVEVQSFQRRLWLRYEIVPASDSVAFWTLFVQWCRCSRGGCCPASGCIRWSACANLPSIQSQATSSPAHTRNNCIIYLHRRWDQSGSLIECSNGAGLSPNSAQQKFLHWSSDDEDRDGRRGWIQRHDECEVLTLTMPSHEMYFPCLFASPY
jgi:hypothetical protein